MFSTLTGICTPGQRTNRDICRMKTAAFMDFALAVSALVIGSLGLLHVNMSFSLSSATNGLLFGGGLLSFGLLASKHMKPIRPMRSGKAYRSATYPAES